MAGLFDHEQLGVLQAEVNMFGGDRRAGDVVGADWRRR